MTNKRDILLTKVLELRESETTREFLNWRLCNHSEKTDSAAWEAGIKSFIDANGFLLVDEVNNYGSKSRS